VPGDKDLPGWRLVDFEHCLDRWIELERPVVDLSLLVTGWIFTRRDDPYQGMRRESGFANLWFGRVPGSENGDGQVVTCSLWIEEATRTVRCDSFATLNLPI
jgi:hypothetical protein